MLLDWKISIVKMTVLLKAVYRFNAIAKEKYQAFFPELKTIKKFA